MIEDDFPVAGGRAGLRAALLADGLEQLRVQMGGDSSTPRRTVAVCLPCASRGLLKTAAIAEYTEVLDEAEAERCITSPRRNKL